jgi:hypothetical protein
MIVAEEKSSMAKTAARADSPPSCHRRAFPLVFRHPMRIGAQRASASEPMSDERLYLNVIILLGAVVAGLMTLFAVELHRNFLTIAIDTAYEQSCIVNTMHGYWFSFDGPGGPNMLAAHTWFVILLLVPLYSVLPYTETLFVVQVIGVYSTVIPIYLVAARVLGRPLVAFCVASGALVGPYFVHMAMAPAHPETLIAAAAFWGYYAYLRRHLAGFIAALLFAVCCAEQAALIFAALGVALLVVDDGHPRRRLFGLVSLGGAIFWILLDLLVISPLANNRPAIGSVFAYNYTNWDIKSPAGLPAAILHHPGLALGLLFYPARWVRMLMLVGLPLPAAFFSRRSLLLLLLPVPAYLWMSDQEFFLYFHAYYFTFAFFAGWLGLIFFLDRHARAPRPEFFTLMPMLAINIGLVCAAIGYYFQLLGGVDDDFSRTLRQEFARIPADAAVYSPHRYSAYLSNRVFLVIGDLREPNLNFNAMLDARYPATNVHPDQIDYIVSDFFTDQCGWRQGFMDAAQFKAREDNINALVATGGWKIFWQDNSAVILQRVKP